MRAGEHRAAAGGMQLHVVAGLGQRIVRDLGQSIGESVGGARWALWLSPISWLDKTRPLTGSRFAPLVLIVAFVAVCVSGAALLAQRRDLGGAILPSRDVADARTGLLSSNLGLSARLVSTNGRDRHSVGA